MVHNFASEFVRRCTFTRGAGERIRCYTGTKVDAFHVPRSTIMPPYARYWSTLAGNHPSTSEKTKKNENKRCFLWWGLKLEGSCSPARPSSCCSPVQKLENFGNFVASRSAGPFVGRHFLLERHFAGEMISVGKARRCPFKVLEGGGEKKLHQQPQKKKGGRKRQCPALCEVCLSGDAISR